MPRVVDIRIYPVKGLRGRSLTAAAVEPWGLAGDRRWMVVNPAGRLLSQRELTAMAVIEAEPIAGGLALSSGTDRCEVPFPEASSELLTVSVWRSTVPARAAGAAADAWLSRRLDAGCRLVHMHDTAVRPTNPAYSRPDDRVSFADGYPLLLTNMASLADLNGRLATPVGMDRFRANLVIEGADAFAEDGWSRLRVGQIAFRMPKPCGRCIVITVDQATGSKAEGGEKAEPLRTLARYHRRDQEALFGINLIPDQTGQVRVGDEVEIF